MTSPANLMAIKVLSLLGLFAITSVFAVVPLNIKPSSQSVLYGWKRLVLALSTCFSGGVFLGVGLMDLLPDVRSAFKEVLGEKNAFPVAEAVVGAGLLLVLAIEQIVLTIKERHGESVGADDDDNEIDFHNVDGHRHHHDHANVGLRSALLSVALSFHAVFEGLALGLQMSVDDFATLSLAVFCHKAIMAFGLGLSLARAQVDPRRAYCAVATFALASPLGGFVGMALSTTIAASVWPGILQGIAGGTFLFVTFFEVLPKEIVIPKNRVAKMMAVILGFGVASVLVYF